MFLRKKKNPSGVVSIQIIDKRGGKYRVVKTVGSSSNASDIEKLYNDGKQLLAGYQGRRDMFAEQGSRSEEKHVAEQLLSTIENILLNGVQLILNPVFRIIGFDRIDDSILRHLAVSRICHPCSKVATVDYLKSYFDEDTELHKIYRYLDKLHDTQKEAIQRISVAHTRGVLGGKIGLAFYDVTTLYFASDESDELRERGFSKDGKHTRPQVVLGLLVSRDGYPLSYSLFNGAQYEGRTMLPIVEDFVHRFELDDFVVVADSGLMNETNRLLLEAGNYKYIIGARIKNESDKIKRWILSLDRQDNAFHETQKGDFRLIVGYSANRAKKDKQNRDKGVKRLQAAFKTGRITKENINRRGYNKFLEISDNVKVTINQDKIDEDANWDGLKGYITNTHLEAKEVYAQYNGLWQVERAFRITKGTLDLRPMFHFTPRRIEAHVCICFVAYKVYKELERILQLKGINLSVDKVLDIARTITTIKIRLPISNETITKTMLLTSRHKSIAQLFDENFWKTI